MVKLNTLRKLKIVLLSVCVLFSVSLFAQSEKTAEKSTIVMTKSELDSFLRTVADARRAQLKNRQSKRLKQDLTELRSKYQQNSVVQPVRYEEYSNAQIINELRYLNQRIDNMNSNGNQPQNRSRDNSTIIVPGSSNSNPAYSTTDRATTTLIPSNSKDEKIKELEMRIDSLKKANTTKKPYKVDNSASAAFSDSLNMVNNRLNFVRRQMDSLELKMRPGRKQSNKKESAADKTYFKQQVYFDNNSETLGDEYYKYVQDLTQILIQFPEAKILLEGWASPLGKVNYNKQLSMRRAESVEKAFKNNGIDLSRILTSFRGEDKISSAQHARRVDMSIIVR